ncbi:MAG TPA: zincin-like metallopeptidase domain-containing protein [Verrucomicrobiae bacterium]
MKTDTMKHASVYDQITERIIALLEKGTVPWRKPWKSEAGLPRNLVTKKPYRGINFVLLHAMHYESPYWLTFRQALELGGNVRKGEKACPVVFWKQLEREDKQTGETEKIPMMRFYSVFNVAQCDGLKNIPAPVQTPLNAPTKPEEIIAAMPMPPEIKHGMSKAFYSPSADIVAMPDRAQFEKDAGYFATLFHELIHATGHAARLNRPTLTESAGFGSNPYCKEELIAEMGAAFICGQAGIAESILENSAAYVQNWLEQLKNDKKLIVQAAAQAQKAADFILGVKHEEQHANTVTQPDEN